MEGNGYISTSALARVLSNVNVGFTEEELEEIVRAVDTNEDGDIRYEEVIEVMMSK